MKTTIEKTFEVEHPIDQVWAFLSNPEKIATCVPGATLTEKVDDQTYKGLVSMKFGPVAVKYNGEISIKELNQEDYNMVLSGRGLDSKGKGSADMVMNGKLKAKEGGGTEVFNSMEVSVTGMLAQFGSRLITDVSEQMIKQFVSNFKDKLNISGQTEDPSEKKDNSIDGVSLMGAVVKSKIDGLFKGNKEAGNDKDASES
ncbi:MAG: carbon monoxide dehydrogenase subunit G [Saprospiraceae bacterium]|nr:MAG: carbon monoxide dehydrogenase subunit G [Saprospiraceae bacterium]